MKKTISSRRVGLNRYLRESVKRIRHAFPRTRRIILFGSHAYGKPSEDSDIDIFIEVPTRQRLSTRYQVMDRLFDPRPCGIDLIIKTPQEVHQILRDFNPCFEDILQKGRILYARRTTR
ncbi:MAG: nucleotidyltransferase domain-containing protein [Candidatus Omnitrophica bacterium]|nr:nucleotidyltransferase domain-containing protein [Candidatus Omnitrophota bacterium]MBI2174306.1 nucleotidyltransferase domain-containing protein [Candidatus Omnitrophota bacterium]MBI3010754.1 nucleotidyltransferase domain-containing protein [Candidatus Omnitrophota bacterium]